jgi:hypothetical protein
VRQHRAELYQFGRREPAKFYKGFAGAKPACTMRTDEEGN